jgi:hypothetical protein
LKPETVCYKASPSPDIPDLEHSGRETYLSLEKAFRTKTSM